MSGPTSYKSSSMMPALILSVLAHIGLVVFVLATGMFEPEPMTLQETPVMVEFVSEEAAAPSRPEEPKEEPVEDVPPPLEEDKPQPAPKALDKPEPPKKQLEVAEKTEIKPVKPVPKNEVKKPEPPKQEPEKPKEEPKPEPEPELEPVEEEKPEEPAEKDTRAEFTSVLKNLADTQPVDTTRKGPSLTESPTVDRVTAGELGAFQRQIQGCWSLLPGAANAETMAVNLTITVNPDRTVRDVQITDKARYQSDPVFRAASDNAMRALKHPDCTPLDLPVNKYEQWKSITLNFDPKGMF